MRIFPSDSSSSDEDGVGKLNVFTLQCERYRMQILGCLSRNLELSDTRRFR